MMKWVDSHIEVEPPKRLKKITATRFASALGMNPWSSQFNAWCAITRTYEEPFTDNKFTLAGKKIEPKIFEYLRKSYAMDNLRTPTDLYGADYFKKTWGDFFGNTPVFGGMWDALLYEDGKPSVVIEIKTSSRPQDWVDDIPEYYKLQSALYAYLLDIDDVLVVASFLEPDDYDHPEKFKPSVFNTVTRDFSLKTEYPHFDAMVMKAQDWWDSHVVTGISPDYDEKKDAEILEALRTNNLTPDTDIDALVKEAEMLKTEVDAVAAKIADKEKRLKELNDLIKEHAIRQFRDGDKKVEIKGSKFVWSLSRSEKTNVDKDALTADGLLSKYSKTSTTYRMTVN